MIADFRRTVIAHVTDDTASVARLADVARSLPDVLVLAVADSPGAALALSSVRDVANLKHIQLEVPLGKGAALRAGFNACDTDLVAFLDLGGITDPADIARFFNRLDANQELDGIVGYRRRRSITSRAYNAAGSTLFGLRLTDPQSPLKVFKRGAVGQIFEDLRLYNYGFDIELLFQAKRRGLILADEPMSWMPMRRSWPLWKTPANALAALLFVRLLHSPLSRIPFVDLLGRKFYLPAKRSYSIMLFCWRDPRSPLAGGGEAYLFEQAKCWVQQGHRVTWFAQRFKGSAKEEVLDGIRIVRRGGFPSVFILGALWYTWQSGHAFDFIIDCMNGIPFFTPLFSTKPKVCLVYHIHSHHFQQELQPLLRYVATAVETKLVPWIYRGTPFLTISNNTKREMQEIGMSRHPIALVHSGVADALKPGAKSPVPTIVHLGRLKKYKRVRDLIDAFITVKKSVLDARLVIAGTGDDEAPLKAYAAEHHVPDVHFLGRIDDATKIRILQEAWVFGMPSSIEGWGIVVIEANACGTPAVAYNVSGLRDCIVHEQTGLLANSPDEFAAHLTRLLEDANGRAEMSAQALAWSERFSWSASAQETLEIIRRGQRWRALFEPDEVRPGSWKLRIPAPLS